MATAANQKEKLRKVQAFLQISEALNEEHETIGFDVDLTRENGGIPGGEWNCHDLEDALADTFSCWSFACGGSVTLSRQDRACVLQMKLPEEEAFQGIGTIDSLRTENILPYCSTAPYGYLLAQETKIDLDVRDAYECLKDNFKLVMPEGSMPKVLRSLPGIASKAEVSHLLTWEVKSLLSGVDNVTCTHKSGQLYDITSRVASHMGITQYYVDIVWNAEKKYEMTAHCSCPVGSSCTHCDATIYKLAEESSSVSSASYTEPEFLIPIHATIKEHMYKGEFTLQLQKLHVYNTGGHFHSHVNTPTGDPALFVGTCVVCLPHSHTGGALKVTHGDKDITFDFGAHSANKSVIQFAAMYGDCAHEVQKVLSGSRLVLIYSLLSTTKTWLKPQQTSISQFRSSLTNVRHSSIYQRSKAQLLQRLSSAMRVARGEYDEPMEYFGVFLAHLYTRTGLVASGLKGCDLVLFDLLQICMVPVSLVAVKVHENYAVLDDNDYDDDMTDFTVALLANCADTRLPVHVDVTGVPFFSPWAHDKVLLKSIEIEPKHQGNWVEAGNVERLYVKAAMIIGPIATDEEEEEEEEMENGPPAVIYFISRNDDVQPSMRGVDDEPASKRQCKPDSK
jgi:hypothetical protein